MSRSKASAFPDKDAGKGTGVMLKEFSQNATITPHLPPHQFRVDQPGVSKVS